MVRSRSQQTKILIKINQKIEPVSGRTAWNLFSGAQLPPLTQQPGRPPSSAPIRRAAATERWWWRAGGASGCKPGVLGVPLPSPSIVKFHVAVRQEISPVLPSKRHFLSHSLGPVHISSDRQSNRVLLAHFSEPDLYRIQPNGARCAIIRKQ